MERFKKHSFKKNTYAVAGVIEALLLVALVAIVLSTIQLIYIPEIMEQKEADHMDEVANQFAHLKSVIDSQALMGVLNSNEPIAKAPMSSPITLGSKELPYFITARSQGQVDVITRGRTLEARIETNPDLLPTISEFQSAEQGYDGVPLTSICYESVNMYFHNQKYILEGGGIFLNQSGSEVMLVEPPMSFENQTNDIVIYYNIPFFFSYPGKNVTAGYQNTFVRTNYSRHFSHTIGKDNIANFWIYTFHPGGWEKALVNQTTGMLWAYENNGYINVDIDRTQSPAKIDITPGTKNIDIEFTVVKIGVQVGQGIINQKN